MICSHNVPSVVQYNPSDLICNAIIYLEKSVTPLPAYTVTLTVALHRKGYSIGSPTHRPSSVSGGAFFFLPSFRGLFSIFYCANRRSSLRGAQKPLCFCMGRVFDQQRVETIFSGSGEGYGCPKWGPILFFQNVVKITS